ncbi:hypothetical protein ACF0H5_023468 [Mactra antiquata]
MHSRICNYFLLQYDFVLQGAICIFVLLNVVGINESHSAGGRGVRERTIIQHYPIFLPSGGNCLPCGSNSECIPQHLFCDGPCDCSGCQDEFYCADGTSKNKRLFDASCSVGLSQTTSTIRSTRTTTSTSTTTVTSVKTKTGTAVVNSNYLSSGSFTFIDTTVLTTVIMVGNNFPAMATVCSIVEGAAVGANRFRLDPTTVTLISSATFIKPCSATTVFPQH